MADIGDGSPVDLLKNNTPAECSIEQAQELVKTIHHGAFINKPINPPSPGLKSRVGGRWVGGCVYTAAAALARFPVLLYGEFFF
jgi:hypothetical protein